MVRVVFKHWKSGELLEVIGEMPPQYNNDVSDRFIVRTPDGHYEDIIKETVVRVEADSASVV